MPTAPAIIMFDWMVLRSMSAIIALRRESYIYVEPLKVLRTIALGQEAKAGVSTALHRLFL